MGYVILSWVFIVVVVVFTAGLVTAAICELRDRFGSTGTKVFMSIIAALMLAVVVFGGFSSVNRSGASTYGNATVVSVTVKTVDGHQSVSLDVLRDGRSSVDHDMQCMPSDTFHCANIKRGDEVKTRRDYGWNGISYHTKVTGMK